MGVEVIEGSRQNSGCVDLQEGLARGVILLYEAKVEVSNTRLRCRECRTEDGVFRELAAAPCDGVCGLHSAGLMPSHSERERCLVVLAARPAVEANPLADAIAAPYVEMLATVGKEVDALLGHVSWETCRRDGLHLNEPTECRLKGLNECGEPRVHATSTGSLLCGHAVVSGTRALEASALDRHP